MRTGGMKATVQLHQITTCIFSSCVSRKTSPEPDRDRRGVQHESSRERHKGAPRFGSGLVVSPNSHPSAVVTPEAGVRMPTSPTNFNMCWGFVRRSGHAVRLRASGVDLTQRRWEQSCVCSRWMPSSQVMSTTTQSEGSQIWIPSSWDKCFTTRRSQERVQIGDVHGFARDNAIRCEP